MTALLVAIGAALGAVCRHLVVERLRAAGATAVGAVLAVNATGSLLLGLVAGHASGAAPGWLLPCVGIGFCGAYTTFATHAVEVATALRSGRTRHAVADLGLNLALGLLLVSLGWTLTA
ncbi:fluoride efflux transporter FluC [Janibacter hoylei]|uniref:Fluoride-specific ion channel FluC n=1 Tax=Janibacter hoylei PVAS-1 TaxID=1210046 RepID=K1E6B2_9MICO|nr:CrcB family protein [Janibacter hoylei]EKA60942.1 CrcB protein [Janibacter hoylei PVAS-1]MCT1620025.1 CrcB family protein [Janibacter hoylei]MCT2294251.1 CrcB family protein [Janibacter hoylei]MCW4601381.1 CrcB family protein [Janibacter hoylei]RWU82991.1 CrcB family protein [Janibacter hoylei PVAS-1]